ncbi:MAG: 23S rRNA (guanosine(2251)-2'-O)-methyltransferase RlmB [Deltaproteobacteria bacterium]|nr:23S rRNA (guanosine(2251)-2'-O)-methyltransferase RlmB [Deltaproteobacteria bacterium]
MRIVYGVNPVLEALRGGGAVDKVMVSSERADRAARDVIEAAKARKVEVARAPKEELDRLCGTAVHQGVAAFLAGEFAYRDIDGLIAAWKGSGQAAFFLVLDSIQDPQNFGSLVRTAHAAGVHGIIIPKDRATEVTPAVVKASAGATEHTLIAREVNLVRAVERLKDENVWVAGIEAGCKESIYEADLDRDLAIVVGSEGKGIRRLVRESCDFCLSIPMNGVLNSLNAAQAGAVAMFEARRQRLFKKK